MAQEQADTCSGDKPHVIAGHWCHPGMKPDRHITKTSQTSVHSNNGNNLKGSTDSELS
jgi:hypothetical protein